MLVDSIGVEKHKSKSRQRRTLRAKIKQFSNIFAVCFNEYLRDGLIYIFARVKSEIMMKLVLRIGLILVFSACSEKPMENGSTWVLCVQI